MNVQVQRDFEELPPPAVHALRDKLVGLTLQHARSSPAVRTQLCLALAALALHLPAGEWAADGGAGGNVGVVYWLWSRFGSQPPDIALPCMLELLTVLPEVRILGYVWKIGGGGSHCGEMHKKWRSAWAGTQCACCGSTHTWRADKIWHIVSCQGFELKPPNILFYCSTVL